LLSAGRCASKCASALGGHRVASMPETIREFNVWERMSAPESDPRCDEPAALTFAVEMGQSGHGTMLWNRLLIIASDDIGLAEPNMPANIYAPFQMWKPCQGAELQRFERACSRRRPS
jgi:hypothetical protein